MCGSGTGISCGGVAVQWRGSSGLNGCDLPLEEECGWEWILRVFPVAAKRRAWERRECRAVEQQRTAISCGSSAVYLDRVYAMVLFLSVFIS